MIKTHLKRDQKIKQIIHNLSQMNKNKARPILRNADPDAEDNEKRTEEGRAEAHLLPEEEGSEGGGGEGGGVGDGDGEGDGGGGEEGEESGGGGEVEEEGHSVLPGREQRRPSPELAEEAAPVVVAGVGEGAEAAVPDEGAAAHGGVGGAPDQADSHHLLHLAHGHRGRLLVAGEHSLPQTNHVIIILTTQKKKQKQNIIIIVFQSFFKKKPNL